jgi:hypothetical protein
MAVRIVTAHSIYEEVSVGSQQPATAPVHFAALVERRYSDSDEG